MDNPINFFNDNWTKARSNGDANANYCFLATVSSAGKASVRTLVLREVTDDSFVIFINSSSPKWQQLQQTKQLELLVFWPTLMQQYRIGGQYSEISAQLMQKHWAKKPYNTKIIDHYYNEHELQTNTIESREALLTGIAKLKTRYPTDGDIPFPDNARGISIEASYIEIWQGSAPDQFHDRELYRFSEGVWHQQFLVP